MRSAIERHLVTFVILVSVALTGLTIWAVAEQGRALQARELADLRRAAATAAGQRQATLRADVERAFGSAARAWEAGGADELDTWTAARPEWLLVCSATTSRPWIVYPRTPLEEPLPESQPAGRQHDAADAARNEGGHDLLTMLRDFQRLATSPDPLTRSGALLGMAACEQQLGHPLAAARIFADAAQLLRSTPPLARFAIRAELARIDSLLAAGDQDRARETFALFLPSIVSDHPARLGPAELARLEHQAETLHIGPADPLAANLTELRRRVQRRVAFVDAATRVLGIFRQDPPPGVSHTTFLCDTSAAGEAFIIAARLISSDTHVALVCPAADLLQHYWNDAPADTRWRARLPAEREDATALAELGPEFANAVLEPTPATAADLRAAARRHLEIVLATAGGTAGAWVLVIWMLTRVVARQRELTRLQGRFVADVSHELKTPLALIRLLAETLAGRRVRDPERIQAYHETITRESERLSVLLDNILDLGRIESGRKQYEFRECDVAAVARQAWALFEPQFSEERFDARLEIAEHLPTIRADGQALQQVIVNLLQNAYRYAGDGKYVRLGVAREGFVILITVEDHGLGMNRSQLNRLGESFFRADDTRVRKSRGVGLGLAIVNHIVTAHRGKVDVQSRPGQGTKFTVWIPFEPT